MIHSLTWLPGVLKAAGLKVALIDDWESHGRGDVGKLFGVICHHTAGSLRGNMSSLDTLINGRSDLPGPLAQLGLGRTVPTTCSRLEGATTLEWVSGTASRMVMPTS